MFSSLLITTLLIILVYLWSFHCIACNSYRFLKQALLTPTFPASRGRHDRQFTTEQRLSRLVSTRVYGLKWDRDGNVTG